MKSLNINIPTTVRFIKAIAKFWVFVLIMLITLLYIYFWLNTTEENGIGISVNTNYITDARANLHIRLNDSIRFSNKHKIRDVIELSCNGYICEPNYREYLDSLRRENDKKFRNSLQNPDTITETGKFLYENRIFLLNSESIIDNTKQTWSPINKEYSERTDNAPAIKLSVRSKNKIIDVFNSDKKNKEGYFWSGNIVQEYNYKNCKVYTNKTINSYIYEIASKDGDYYEKISHYIAKSSPQKDYIKIENSYLGNFFSSLRSKIRVHLSVSFKTVHNDPEYSYKNKKDKDFGSYGTLSGISIHHYQLPLYILTLYPEPDEIDRHSIEYTTRKKLNQIKDEGITIYAENLNNKDRNEKLNFILASFIGVLFSVLAEIGVKHFNGKRKSNPPTTTSGSDPVREIPVPVSQPVFKEQKKSGNAKKRKGK